MDTKFDIDMKGDGPSNDSIVIETMKPLVDQLNHPGDGKVQSENHNQDSSVQSDDTGIHSIDDQQSESVNTSHGDGPDEQGSSSDTDRYQLSPFRTAMIDFDSKLPCSPDPQNPMLKNIESPVRSSATILTPAAVSSSKNSSDYSSANSFASKINSELVTVQITGQKATDMYKLGITTASYKTSELSHVKHGNIIDGTSVEQSGSNANTQSVDNVSYRDHLEPQNDERRRNELSVSLDERVLCNIAENQCLETTECEINKAEVQYPWKTPRCVQRDSSDYLFDKTALPAVCNYNENPSVTVQYNKYSPKTDNGGLEGFESGVVANAPFYNNTENATALPIIRYESDASSRSQQRETLGMNLLRVQDNDYQSQDNSLSDTGFVRSSRQQNVSDGQHVDNLQTNADGDALETSGALRQRITMLNLNTRTGHNVPNDVVRSCPCSEMQEGIPAEQLFLHNGEIHQLSNAAIVCIGNIEVYAFIRQNSFFIPLGCFLKLVNQDIRDLFNNMVKFDTICLYKVSTYEKLLLEQKCSNLYDNTCDDLLDLFTLQDVCALLLSVNPGNQTLLMLANSKPCIKMLDSNLICSCCGLQKKGKEENELCAPFEQVKNDKSLLSVTGGILHFGTEKLYCFALKDKFYISLKEIKTHSIMTVRQVQQCMQRLNRKPILAPKELSEYFNTRTPSIRDTLWIDLPTFQCILCMNNLYNKKSEFVRKIIRDECNFVAECNASCKDIDDGSNLHAINSSTCELVELETARKRISVDLPFFFVSERAVKIAKKKEQKKDNENISKNTKTLTLEEDDRSKPTQTLTLEEDDRSKPTQTLTLEEEPIKDSDPDSAISELMDVAKRCEWTSAISVKTNSKLSSTNEVFRNRALYLRPRKQLRNTPGYLQKKKRKVKDELTRLLKSGVKQNKTEDNKTVKDEQNRLHKSSVKQNKTVDKKTVPKVKMVLEPGDYIVRDIDTFVKELDNEGIAGENNEGGSIRLQSEESQAIATLQMHEIMQNLCEDFRTKQDLHLPEETSAVTKGMGLYNVVPECFETCLASVIDIPFSNIDNESNVNNGNTAGDTNAFATMRNDSCEDTQTDTQPAISNNAVENGRNQTEVSASMCTHAMREGICCKGIQNVIDDKYNRKMTNLSVNDNTSVCVSMRNDIFTGTQNEIERSIFNDGEEDNGNKIIPADEDTFAEDTLKTDNCEKMQNSIEISMSNTNEGDKRNIASPSTDINVLAEDTELNKAVQDMQNSIEWSISNSIEEDEMNKAGPFTDKNIFAEEDTEIDKTDQSMQNSIGMAFSKNCVGESGNKRKPSAGDDTYAEETIRNETVDEQANKVNKAKPLVSKSGFVEDTMENKADQDKQRGIEGSISEFDEEDHANKAKSAIDGNIFQDVLLRNEACDEMENNNEMPISNKYVEDDVVKSKVNQCSLSEDTVRYESNQYEELGVETISEIVKKDDLNKAVPSADEHIDPDVTSRNETCEEMQSSFVTFSNDNGKNGKDQEEQSKEKKTNKEETVRNETSSIESSRERKRDRVSQGELSAEKNINEETVRNETSEEKNINEKRREMEKNIREYLVFKYDKERGFRVEGFKDGAEEVFPALFKPYPEHPDTKYRKTQFIKAAKKYMDDLFSSHKQRYCGNTPKGNKQSQCENTPNVNEQRQCENIRNVNEQRQCESTPKGSKQRQCENTLKGSDKVVTGTRSKNSLKTDSRNTHSSLNDVKENESEKSDKISLHTNAADSGEQFQHSDKSTFEKISLKISNVNNKLNIQCCLTNKNDVANTHNSSDKCNLTHSVTPNLEASDERIKSKEHSELCSNESDALLDTEGDMDDKTEGISVNVLKDLNTGSSQKVTTYKQDSTVSKKSARMTFKNKTRNKRKLKENNSKTVTKKRRLEKYVMEDKGSEMEVASKDRISIKKEKETLTRSLTDGNNNAVDAIKGTANGNSETNVRNSDIPVTSKCSILRSLLTMKNSSDLTSIKGYQVKRPRVLKGSTAFNADITDKNFDTVSCSEKREGKFTFKLKNGTIDPKSRTFFPQCFVRLKRVKDIEDAVLGKLYSKSK